MHLIDPNTKLDVTSSNELVIAREQDITPEYLDSLKAARDASSSNKMGDWHRAASIPVAIHETWLRQGYDCTKEPIRKTLLKLQLEGLDNFITTSKVI